jgi:hypothetical protein
MEGLDCRKCSSQIRKIRGCDEDVAPYNVAGYQITRCPLKHATYFDLIALQVFKEYNAGFLPNGGGWLDQPMKFSMIVQMIDGIVRRLEERRAKDAEPRT